MNDSTQLTRADILAVNQHLNLNGTTTHIERRKAKKHVDNVDTNRKYSLTLEITTRSMLIMSTDKGRLYIASRRTKSSHATHRSVVIDTIRSLQASVNNEMVTESLGFMFRNTRILMELVMIPSKLGSPVIVMNTAIKIWPFGLCLRVAESRFTDKSSVLFSESDILICLQVKNCEMED